MAEETLNMRPVSIETFIGQLKEDILDEIYQPYVGIGKAGVGKTESIHGLAQELGIGYKELRLVTLNETDLLGIPDFEIDSSGKKHTTFASNNELPYVERDGEKGILVLDEITSASPNIRAAAYQLLDSKRALGNYKLPDKWIVVALGNGPDDGGVFNGMEAAFLSRATCFRIEPDLDSWKHWGIKNGVNSSVIAFMDFDPTKLHVFDPDAMASQFPCPRSWTTLSRKLNLREERRGRLLTEDEISLLAAGTIGDEVSASFAAFYAYNKETISPEDILSGQANSDISNLEPQVMYLIIQSLIKTLASELGKDCTSKKAFERTGNACNWLIDISNHSLDYAITGIKDLTSSVKEFSAIVLDDEFDEICPRLLKFASDVNIILNPID